MLSVIDQLDWTVDTDSTELVKLVSEQLGEQEDTRSLLQRQLIRDYPLDSLGWLSAVSWSPPKLVSLSSFDLEQAAEAVRWEEYEAVRELTNAIREERVTPIVAVRVPGCRLLTLADGHVQLGIYARLYRPALAWVGRAHATHGPWEHFRYRRRESSDFTSIADQVIELDFDPGGSGVRHVRTARGVYFFKEPIGTPITEAQYQELLAQRKAARAAHAAGHPDRVAAERAVRQARKMRSSSAGADSDTASPDQDPVTQEVNEVSQSADQALAAVKTEAAVTGDNDTGSSATHSDLLAARREAQSKYPAGHPERVKAERAVRASRKAARSGAEPAKPVEAAPKPEEAAPTSETKPAESAKELSPAEQEEQRKADQRFTIRAALIKHYGASAATDNDVERARVAIWLAKQGGGPNVEDLSPEKQALAKQIIDQTSNEEISRIATYAEQSKLFSKQEADLLRTDFARAKEESAKGELKKSSLKLALHIAFITAGAVLSAMIGMTGTVLSPVLIAGLGLLPPIAQEIVDRWRRL